MAVQRRKLLLRRPRFEQWKAGYESKRYGHQRAERGARRQLSDARNDAFRAKASDPRPESFRVDEGSIRLIERGKKLSDAAKVRLWQPFIASSLTQLHAAHPRTFIIIGLLRSNLYPDELARQGTLKL